jgi:ubiquinone/menaquinone biosynthesis C-methylase UbiE
MLKIKIPWRLKIILKIILARLPFNIHTFWRNIGMFRHGNMDSTSYVISNFFDLLNHASLNAKECDGLNFLEVGAGDSIGSGVVASSFGMKPYIIDVDAFATKDIEFYKNIIVELKNPISDISANDLISYEQMVKKLDITYLTDGTSSFKKIDDNSINIIISQACLEHVRKKEFKFFVNENYRVCKKGALSIHSIDFKDHLEYSLNNLRFSERFWESEFISSSGFYTNRLRYCDMKEIFLKSGFEIIKEDLSSWNELPLRKTRLNRDFINYNESDLLVKEAVVVLRKN